VATVDIGIVTGQRIISLMAPNHSVAPSGFGTLGKRTAQSTAFKKSSFAKSKPSTHSKAARGLRGAGAENRGRGPSGTSK